MDFISIFGEDLLNWIIIPIVIFISRILDVSLDTLKVVFVAQGFKKLAVLSNFLGTLVWIVIVRQVITNMENPIWLVAYALGASTGTYVGLIISDKMAIGKVSIRANIRNNPDKLIKTLRKKGFGVTVVEAHGRTTKSKLLHSVIKAKDIKKYVKTIEANNPKAFYTIENIRSANQGIFTQSEKSFSSRNLITRLTSFGFRR